MKKLHFNNSISQGPIVFLVKSIFLIFVFNVLAVSNANTMPNIINSDNVLDEDIVNVVTYLPSDRVDTTGVNRLINACGVWAKDGNDHPHPSYSGIPTTDCPNASIVYQDDRIDGCSTTTYELVRTWTIVDSCSNNAITIHEQKITVGDISNPILVAPDEFTVLVPTFDCTVDFDVIPMTVVFECSEYDYNVSYMLIDDPAAAMYDAAGNSTDGYVIEDIAANQDTVWVIYTVTDACGNMKKAFTEVKIDNSLNEGVNLFRISGPRVTCVNSSESYSVENLIGASYDWKLVSGGVISGDPTNYSIDVDWGGVPSPDYEMSVEITSVDGCVYTDTIHVLVGTATGLVALTDDINFSLGASCALTVTPAMVNAGPLAPDGAFEVQLMDDAGNEILDATLTSEHVGWPIMVILRNVCSGNSAMGTLYVFDKMGPTLTCVDKELYCYEVANDLGPDAIDNCGGVVTLSKTDSSFVVTNCDPDFMGEIVQTFVAYDEYGNASLPCTYSIFVKRFPMDDIVPAADFMIVDDTALECGTFEVDDNGNPAVSVTGTPTLYDNSIYPTIDLFCGVGIGYTDNIINTSTCNTKIMRTWTIFESWCTLGNLKTFTQVIEIVDTTPPVVTCLSNMTVTTNGSSCNGDVLLPALSAYDLCSTNLSYDVETAAGTLHGQNGGLVSLPMGNNTVTYTVTDECNNITTCTFDVVVEDKTPPIAVLYQNVVVSLTEDGTAWVPATKFDAGSFDDCALWKVEAMRMDEGAPCGIVANTFEDNVHFCCADVGEVMVIVRLTDNAGNTNDAMISVEVQDKTKPIISCPADTTVLCGYIFDLEDFSAFGEPVVTDACDDTYTESLTSNISPCGTGYYDRKFTSFDGSVNCIQRINVISANPFNYNSIDWPDDYFPEDACSDADLSPDSLDYPFDYPKTTTEVCQYIGFSHKDVKYTVSNACYKIIRTWTVLDDCDPNAYPLHYDQTIMVSNSVPPVISGTLDPVQATSDNCIEGDITLTATATDDCTDDSTLFNSYKIDLDNDGTYGPAVNGIGATISFNGTYPLGNHKVSWTFEDRCGNVVTRTQLFSIINIMDPIAYCLDGLSVGLTAMDLDNDGVLETEMACVNATMFNGQSSSPCGYDIKFSFSEDLTDTTLCVTCEDIGQYPISLYVTDENGNSSFCTTYLQVQDNNNVNICQRNCDLLVHPADNFEVNTCGDDLSPDVINSNPVVPPNSPCQDYTSTYTDEVVTDYNTDNCIFILRSWTVTFNCGSDEVCEFQQTIIRNNYIAAQISCPAGIVVTADGTTCDMNITVPSPIVLAHCNTGVVVTNSFNNGGSNASGSYPVGTTPVVYTVTDACDNVAVCTVNIQVLDGVDPVCNAANTTVSLGDNGTLTLTPQMVNNGSVDECGEIVNMTVTPNQFDCDDAGETIEVTLTVFDDSGNSSSCTADVTIEDNSIPTAHCMSNGTVTYYLDSNGSATVNPVDLNNGSSVICGSDLTYTVDINELDCDNIPNQSIALTVTSSNGESNTCTSIVNVLDTISPICNTQNITVNVGEVFNASQINNGSTDNCTPANELGLSLNVTSFGCDDMGGNTVILTVTDEYSNSSTCTATVTVIDNGLPTCATQNITVQLDANGNVSITAAQIDDGSMNFCGVDDVTLAVAPSTFDCTNVGANTVTLTVTADNGQTSTCTATVTVEDNIAPLCATQNFTIAVGDTLLVSDINDGSSDVCTAVTMSVAPFVFDCDDVADVQTVTLTVSDENGNSTTCTAEVTVVDNGQPVCNAQDVTIQLDANGNATVTAAQVDNGSMNACSGGDVTLAVAPSTFDCTNVGANTVALTVTADNGETSTCTATVTVEDNLDPICSTQDTTVYLDVNGNATIDSSFINNGSSDNCGIATIDVSPTVFNCDNVGPNTVTMTVTDVNGNTSTCNASVLVVDTIGALCATQNITIPLDNSGNATITAAQIDNGSTSGSCGGTLTLSVSPSEFDCSNVGDNIVTMSVTINGNTSTCNAIVTITEDEAPALSCPANDTLTCQEYTSNYATFGSATATDNCDTNVAISESIVESLNSCSVGTVVRTFIAVDDSGNADTCTQTLLFELGDNPFSLSDITFPSSPVNVFNCAATDPSATGEPVVNTQNADCSDVTFTFSDVGNGAGCDDTILRTWTVTDACQVDGTGAGVFTFVQTINAIDNEAPVIVGPADTVLTLTVPVCDGYIDLSAVTITDCHSYTVINDSPFADDNNSADASGNYEEGITVFTITATDECGNISIDTVTVEVINGENEFTCKKIFFNMDDDLEVIINSYIFTDIIYGCAFENGDLTFSFSNTDENDFLDTLRCVDLGFDIPIKIYAYINGVLYDSCSTIAHLEDPNNFCSGNLVPGIAGLIYTPEFDYVGGVSVDLQGDDAHSYMTSNSGVYEFMDIETANSYNVVPFKDDDHMNGVSTLDLILIQRHILGMKKFTSPYQMIAADINNNGKINAGDLIQLRKLILGKVQSFKNNTSWRFIDSKHEEWDMSLVLDMPIPEEYYINSLENMMYINWLGVKIGDVDGSVKSNTLTDLDSEERTAETSILVLEDRYVKEGEEFIVDFKLDKEQDILGFQFTLSFIPSMVSYNGADNSAIGLNDGYIGDRYAERGQLAISWNDINTTHLLTDDNVVSLRFTAEKDMKLSECFAINSSLINAEWYSDKTRDLQLVFNNEDTPLVQLLSNVPNPWSDRTDINFFLPSEMDVEFSVYDMSGRKLISKMENYNAGLNTISIDKSDLSVDGILYYEIKTSNTKIVKKMILLRR